MFFVISNRQFERFINMFKDEAEALIKTIATGGTDQDTKDAVKQLQDGFAALQAEADQSKADVADSQAVILDILKKLQAGDTAGALEAAKAATVDNTSEAGKTE